jgi:AcrR family transcriptional regulator
MVARAEALDATRDAILDAAVEAFWERPAVEISLEEIAAASGVSKRTVLRHFESKQGLFEATGLRERERIARQRDTAPPGDVPAAVRVLVDHYEEMGERVLRLLAEEHAVPSLHEVAELGRHAHRDWCKRVFADALEPMSGVDHDRRLAQLVAICDVYTWKLLRLDARLSRRQTEQAMVELLDALIGGR